MRSDSFSTMGTAFPRFLPRNDPDKAYYNVSQRISRVISVFVGLCNCGLIIGNVGLRRVINDWKTIYVKCENKS